MKRICLGLLIVTLAARGTHAQDAATQQQIDKLTGSIQDLTETVAQDGKRIDELEKAVNDMRDKVNTPATTGDYANNDDLKKLAAQLQEIDKKRQDDRDLILKQIEKLGAATGGSGTHIHASSSTTTTSSGGEPGATATVATGPQKGYEYEVKEGQTLSAIVKAYRDQGVKVTTSQVLKANPGLDPNKLYVGKKIFIPDANAK